jgi:heme/copper-type cytochrome/quinol oxidase subunit 2
MIDEENKFTLILFTIASIVLIVLVNNIVSYEKAKMDYEYKTEIQKNVSSTEKE